MEKILSNLALIHLLDYCKKTAIDCSGTHLSKHYRRFTYALVNDHGKEIVAVTFHKSSVPTYLVTK